MKRKGKKFSHFLQQLNDPPSWVLVLLYATMLTGGPLAVFALLRGYDSGYAIIAYVVCVLLLIYTVYVTVRLIIKTHNKVGEFADRYTFTRRFYRNYEFRSVIFTACSFLGNLAYTLFLCYTAWKSSSHWYMSLALYYVLLTTARGGILVEAGKQEWRFKNDPAGLEKEKLRSYFYCGVMMIALTAALAVAVVQMVDSGERLEVPRVSIYVFAAVACYRIFASIFNFIRSKLSHDLTVRSVQYINFTTALVALLSLQTVLLDAFSTSSNARWLNTLTGAAVCFAVLLLGVHMIIRTTRLQRRIGARERERREKEMEMQGYNRAEYHEEYFDGHGKAD